MTKKGGNVRRKCDLVSAEVNRIMYGEELEMHIRKEKMTIWFHNYFEEQTALLSLIIEGTNDLQNQKSLCLTLAYSIVIAD